MAHCFFFTVFTNVIVKYFASSLEIFGNIMLLVVAKIKKVLIFTQFLIYFFNFNRNTETFGYILVVLRTLSENRFFTEFNFFKVFREFRRTNFHLGPQNPRSLF